MQDRGSAASLVAVLVLAMVLTVGVAGGVAAAGGGFGMFVSGGQSVDVPPRTVSVDGTTFEVTRLVVVREGETVTASVTAPNDDVYSTNVYNSDEQLVDFSRGEGSGTHHFDAADLGGPGTYSLGVVQDGDVEAVQPLVVSGYDFDVAIPGELPTDEVVEVELTVMATSASGPPGGVELVLADEISETRIEATHVDGQTYVATVDADSFGTGEYGAYAVALDRAGEENAVGVSHRHTVSFVEPPAGDPEGSVTGTATDAETDEPIADVAVELSASGEVIAETTTDADGTYRVGELEPDGYALAWRADGYEPADTTVTVGSGETTTVDVELTPVDERDEDGVGEGEDGGEGDGGHGSDADDDHHHDDDHHDDHDDHHDDHDHHHHDDDGDGESDAGADQDGDERESDERTDDGGDGDVDDDARADGDDALPPNLPADDDGDGADSDDDDVGMPIVVLTVLAIATVLTYALRSQ